MLYLQLVEERFGLNIDVSWPIIISNLKERGKPLLTKPILDIYNHTGTRSYDFIHIWF